jgi:hypothetical protein
MNRDHTNMRAKPDSWPWASNMIIVLISAVAASVGCGKREQAYIPVPVNPSPPSRPVHQLPDQAFRVEWVGHDVPAFMKAGASRRVTVTFKNASTLPWPDPDSTSYEPPEAGAVRLAYRWWSASSPTPSAWGSRADLQRLLQPGQTATLSLSVTAPAQPGSYRLQFDLVQEMATFFGDRGAAQLVVPVRIGAGD